LVEAAISRERHYNKDTGHRRLGIDVARYGDDRTVFALRDGANVEKVRVEAKLSTMEVAGIIVSLIKQWTAHAVYIDVIGSLHKAAASSVFRFRYPKNFGPHRWFFTASGRNRRQHSGPTQAPTVRGRNVLNADRSATNVSRAHSPGPRPLLAEGRKRKPIISSLFSLRPAV